MNQLNMPPAVNAFLTALRYFLVAIGGMLLVLHKDGTTAYHIVIEAAAATMIIGPAAWGIWVAAVGVYKSFAAAVQAGINMTASGQAIDAQGDVISKFENSATTPPKAVTMESAKAIVSSFAPAPGSIEKS